MTTNIFSTYSTGENRVTASIIAVLQSLSLSRIETLLGALLEQSEFELVRFQNQPNQFHWTPNRIHPVTLLRVARRAQERTHDI